MRVPVILPRATEQRGAVASRPRRHPRGLPHRPLGLHRGPRVRLRQQPQPPEGGRRGALAVAQALSLYPGTCDSLRSNSIAVYLRAHQAAINAPEDLPNPSWTKDAHMEGLVRPQAQGRQRDLRQRGHHTGSVHGGLQGPGLRHDQARLAGHPGRRPRCQQQRPTAGAVLRSRGQQRPRPVREDLLPRQRHPVAVAVPQAPEPRQLVDARLPGGPGRVDSHAPDPDHERLPRTG